VRVVEGEVSEQGDERFGGQVSLLVDMRQRTHIVARANHNESQDPIGRETHSSAAMSALMPMRGLH
jgi:hypothetical protein